MDNICPLGFMSVFLVAVWFLSIRSFKLYQQGEEKHQKVKNRRAFMETDAVEVNCSSDVASKMRGKLVFMACDFMNLPRLTDAPQFDTVRSLLSSRDVGKGLVVRLQKYQYRYRSFSVSKSGRECEKGWLPMVDFVGNSPDSCHINEDGFPGDTLPGKGNFPPPFNFQGAELVVAGVGDVRLGNPSELVLGGTGFVLTPEMRNALLSQLLLGESTKRTSVFRPHSASSQYQPDAGKELETENLYVMEGGTAVSTQAASLTDNTSHPRIGDLYARVHLPQIQAVSVFGIVTPPIQIKHMNDFVSGDALPKPDAVLVDGVNLGSASQWMEYKALLDKATIWSESSEKVPIPGLEPYAGTSYIIPGKMAKAQAIQELMAEQEVAAQSDRVGNVIMALFSIGFGMFSLCLLAGISAQHDGIGPLCCAVPFMLALLLSIVTLILILLSMSRKWLFLIIPCIGFPVACCSGWLIMRAMKGCGLCGLGETQYAYSDSDSEADGSDTPLFS